MPADEFDEQAMTAPDLTYLFAYHPSLRKKFLVSLEALNRSAEQATAHLL